MLTLFKLSAGRSHLGVLLIFLSFGFYLLINLLGESSPEHLESGHSILLESKDLSFACDDINWASWNNFTGNSAVGTIIDGADRININMTANYIFSSTPGIYNHAKFNGYPSPIPNTTVPMTEWSIGSGGTTTMCFSRTVTNPVLLISSLGSSSGIKAKLEFSLPYVVLFNGGGMEFHNSTSLTGTEGYAIIMFPGEFNCVTINSTTREYYTNITWGIRPPPFAIDITENKSCGNTVLTASGGVSYHWDGGETPDRAVNTFLKSGTYIVTVTNAGGCKTSASKKIVVEDGQPVAVSETVNGCQNVSLTASGGIKYEWDGGDNPLSPTNTFHAEGTYTVKITHSNGCISTVSKLVKMNVPVAAISGISTGCRQVTLVANGGVSYLWDGGETPRSATNSFTQGGHYTVVVTDANGCKSNAEVDVIINNPLAASIDISSNVGLSICSGAEVTFNAMIVNGGASPLFNWLRNGKKVSSDRVYKTTDLTNGDEILCELTSSEPCVVSSVAASNKLNIIVKELPTISFNQELIINDNKPIQINPVVEGNVSAYFWFPETGLSDPTIRNPMANPLSTTVYTLTVISSEGCEVQSRVKVTVTKDKLPNVFSPNGDGINDTWNIDLSGYPSATLEIYNRYGECLFRSGSSDVRWDGKYRGQLVPSGIYFYRIDYKYKDLKPVSGSITIL